MSGNGSCGCGGSMSTNPQQKHTSSYHIDPQGRVVSKPPMGAQLTSSGATQSGQGSLGSGGLGTVSTPQSESGEIAYGARPAPPGAPPIRGVRFTDPGMPWNNPLRDPTEAAKDRAAQMMGFLQANAAMGAQWTGSWRPGMMDSYVFHDASQVGLPLHPAARGQYLPAPPAPQDVCVVNGFDPAWGRPPERVWGLRMRFDESVAAYVYDYEYSTAGVNLDYDRLARQTLAEVKRAWDDGRMLQPYRRDDDTWQYRWIPRMRTLTCAPNPNALPAPSM
jgi:hypothetical protein